MKTKVAFFVDWDNLRKIIAKTKRESSKSKNPISTFDFNNSSHIFKLFSSYLEVDEKFYRIFFYTAKPLKDEEIMEQLRVNSNRKKYKKYLEAQGEENRIYNKATKFLEQIVQEDFIALRTGKMQVRGIADAKSGRPDIVQKQVDMLIGLDISEISYKKLADKIMVFSKDTDMIPALKTARINGLIVSIANFEESDYIAKDIILHSDLVITKSFIELDKTL